MEDRRRRDMGDRELRSGNQPVVLGCRQRRPVDGGPAARRQPLHRVNRRHRCCDRPDQGAPSVRSERVVGLGRGLAANPGGLPAKRQVDQRIDQRRTGRLPVVPRTHRAARSISSKASRTCSRTSSRASIPRQDGRISIPTGSPAPARWPVTARRSGAGRTGRRSRSVRRPG